jgi:hypothetical protein
MSFQNIPDRPRVYYDLFRHVHTGEVFAMRREPDTLRITGCVALPWLYCRHTPLEGLPYDADTELVAWAEEHRVEFDLTGLGVC